MTMVANAGVTIFLLISASSCIVTGATTVKFGFDDGDGSIIVAGLLTILGGLYLILLAVAMAGGRMF